MPALDVCHDKVVRALLRDGWAITRQPFRVVTPLNPLFIDLEIGKTGESGARTVLVIEIKCFPDGETTMNDLYVALGQYLVYRTVLEQIGYKGELFLAIPTNAYYAIFQPLIAPLITTLAMKLVLINLEREQVDQWIT